MRPSLLSLVLIAGLVLLTSYATKREASAVGRTSSSDVVDPVKLVGDSSTTTTTTTTRAVKPNKTKKRLDVEGLTSAGSRRLNVMCVLVRDEAKFIRDHIRFHVAAGWTKFYIFDHNSTDGLREVLEDHIASSLVDYERVAWNEAENVGRNPMTVVQDYVYPRCFRRYWGRANVLTTTDVDEFVFPGRETWEDVDARAFKKAKRNALIEAASDMDFFRTPSSLGESSSTAVVVRMECFKFGTQGYRRYTPASNVSLMYTMRAPYFSSEFPVPPSIVSSCRRHNSKECDAPPKGAQKYLYFPNGQREIVIPGIHGPRPKEHLTVGVSEEQDDSLLNRDAEETNQQKSTMSLTEPAKYSLIPESFDESKPNRTRGINCNHIYFRSMRGMMEKGLKNGNKYYLYRAGVSARSPMHSFWNLIEDNEARDFYVWSLR